MQCTRDRCTDIGVNVGRHNCDTQYKDTLKCRLCLDTFDAKSFCSVRHLSKHAPIAL